MFDAEEIVFEAISRQTGVDPSEYSMTTKLQGGREIRPNDLKAIVADIQKQLGKDMTGPAMKLRTVGELVELVEQFGPA